MNKKSYTCQNNYYELEAAAESEEYPTRALYREVGNYEEAKTSKVKVFCFIAVAILAIYFAFYFGIL
ncbi:MAG: hypothetical protein LBN08_02910 [Lactobacillales bacterium]|jgi:hypothetical protein|nr:hypothetical protein [Lactobacillales bacterium]